MITYEDDFFIDGKQWAIGQEGRRFGSSLDICSSGDRETLVVGAPYASWSRTFDDINTSGIPVATMVFTDTFNYSKKEVEKISEIMRDCVELKVPNIVDAEIGSSWGDVKNYKEYFNE